MSARKIFDLVRALDKPYMHAHFFIKNKEIKVFKVNIINSQDNKDNVNFEPGKILLKTKKFFDVKCGEGVIRILKINRKLKLQNIKYI